MIAFTSCNQPKPVKTIADLKDGITGETTASAKYAAFSQKAIEEGYDTIAKFFDAASKAEAIHAENHTKALEEMGEKMDAFTPEFEVKTTAENLREAINGETYEIQKMYPQFLADAKEEKAEKAEKSFSWAFDTEKKHLQFYQKAIEALEGGNESKLSFSYAVCPVCGNTYDANNVDEKCAFCQTGKDKFIFN
ncbi:MAG: rubrerythrin [Bacteroidetes bacterium HGW-Bacteroidetes-21]|nr:MAG: rubrerythrin [Bacteroidetes bacterium HGW-Bacteroidetes-21]